MKIKINEAEIANYVKKYTNKVFKNEYYDQFNYKDCEELVNWQYQLAGFKKPIVFLANNPYEAQVMYSLLEKMKGTKITELFNLLNEEKKDENKISALYSTLKKSLDTDIVSGKVPEKIEYQKSYLYTSDIYTSVLLCWYGYSIDILELDLKVNELFKEWRRLYEKAGVYNGIYADEVCIVTRFPNEINRNENNDLHCTTGPAVKWDGMQWKCYFINGRNIDAADFEKALNGQVTKLDFISQTNEEVKAAWYEIIGQEKIMELLEAELIDTKEVNHSNNEVEILQLFKTKEKFKEINDNHLAWVKFICPSTGTNYLIDVEPHHNNALDAAVSTSPLVTSADDYFFDERA